jgi:hypothetical protein
MEFQFRRVPRWIVAVGIAGALYSLITRGPLAALICALGAAGSWWNYLHLVNATTWIVTSASQPAGQAMGGFGIVRAMGGMFLRFAIVAGGALAILEYSRNSLIPLFLGLFASFIGVGLEIVYELVWKKNTTSG